MLYPTTHSAPAGSNDDSESDQRSEPLPRAYANIGIRTDGYAGQLTENGVSTRISGQVIWSSWRAGEPPGLKRVGGGEPS